jgi:hypothetical protein
VEVKILYTPGKRQCQLSGKGAPGDWGSEGSCEQSAGSRHTKRMEATRWGEQAKRCKARYLHGTVRRISDGHKREGECVIPGESWRSAVRLPALREVGMECQQSAEAIVGAPRTEGPNMRDRK